MEEIAFKHPTTGISCQKDWIEGLLYAYCMRRLFLSETVQHCTWFIGLADKPGTYHPPLRTPTGLIHFL